MKSVRFEGFHPDIFNFLSELNQNPKPEWFNSNRKRYEELFLLPARVLISELAPFLHSISPDIRTEPKINITIKKQFPDARFNPDAKLRDYFLIHFGRFSGDPEFFIYLNKDEIQIGLDINNKSMRNNFFRKNRNNHPEQLDNLFLSTGINKQYALYKLGDPPVELVNSFDISKHAGFLNNYDRLLFQKVFLKDSPFIFTSALLGVSVEIFTQLTPLYHFSTSQR
ncbi:MAG: hypothetical protein SCALA702_20050 [Melioribacteraceae bacterium]|nr:MAG: hypothetical protein SCALA702_20050 [Melioribacteraceae bacterium]